MTVNVTEVKRRLLVFLNDSNLVNEYIRQFGPSIDARNIKAIKELSDTMQSSEIVGAGTDPVYEHHVKCPVCNRETITRYELRAKSQQVTQNKFLVPVYTGVTPYRTVDYTMLAVTVCPRCLFASPDKKDFIYNGISSSHNENKTQLTSNVLMTLQEKIGERKGLLKPGIDAEKYFGRNRTREAAIDSYHLAVLRAKVEAWYEQPYALYKLGAAHLRIAKILKDSGITNSESLHEALGYFEEAFKTSNCPSEEIEMQVIYTIVALYLKLGNPKKANSYIGVFNNLHNTRQAEMRENPNLSLMIIDKWTDKAKTLWEDRAMDDLFVEE